MLIPRRALGNDRPHYFRLDVDTGEVEVVHEAPPTRFRHYRDFLDYEYKRLPGPLRELRKSVLSRNEIYIFGALIPLEEWALVIGRRRAALRASGHSVEDVRRFTVHYAERDDAYDVEVREIALRDGTRIQPTRP